MQQSQIGLGRINCTVVRLTPRLPQHPYTHALKRKIMFARALQRTSLTITAEIHRQFPVLTGQG